MRKKYEDLMQYASAEGSEDLFKGELTWFSAGVRIGVGVGLECVSDSGLESAFVRIQSQSRPPQQHETGF